jgi:hypothetical protein
MRVERGDGLKAYLQPVFETNETLPRVYRHYIEERNLSYFL